MNATHTQEDYRYDLTALDNIRIAFSIADDIEAIYPDLYVVIDTCCPVNQQAIDPTDFDTAATTADICNLADGAYSRYIVVNFNEVGGL